ncbi:unnamed protein product, partial [marine sediment metagenome]
ILAGMLWKWPKLRPFQGPLAAYRISGVVAVLTLPAIWLGWSLTIYYPYPGGNLGITSDWTPIQKGLFYSFGLLVCAIVLLMWMFVGGLLGHLLGRKILFLKREQPQQRIKGIVQDVVLIIYALVLSIWSGNITLTEGNDWLAGAFPIIGWLLTLAWFDLWQSGFALLAALWVVSVAVLSVVRRFRRFTGSASEP